MERRIVVSLLGLAWLAVLGPAELAAQERRITGQVVQAVSEQPVSNATITVIGAAQSTGVLSGADGRFTIAVPVGEIRLEVRAIGHAGSRSRSHRTSRRSGSSCNRTSSTSRSWS